MEGYGKLNRGAFRGPERAPLPVDHPEWSVKGGHSPHHGFEPSLGVGMGAGRMDWEWDCIDVLRGYDGDVSNLTLEIEKTLPCLEADSARQFELAVRAMLSMARRKEGEMEDTFVRLAQEEEALRESMRQQGRQFSACEGLTREELHDRHALR